MKVAWSDFKSACVSKGLNIQCESRPLVYSLAAYDGPLLYTSSVLKDDGADHVDFQTNFLPNVNQRVEKNSPFADKNIGDKKLFRRKHGYKLTLDGSGEGTLVVVVPYDACKINEFEVVGSKCLDVVKFKILDKAVAPISGVPNLMLNQFGFDVNMCEHFYRDKSEYDADIYKDMQLKIEYISATPSITIGINIVYHEVK